MDLLSHHYPDDPVPVTWWQVNTSRKSIGVTVLRSDMDDLVEWSQEDMTSSNTPRSRTFENKPSQLCPVRGGSGQDCQECVTHETEQNTEETRGEGGQNSDTMCLQFSQ